MSSSAFNYNIGRVNGINLHDNNDDGPHLRRAILLSTAAAARNNKTTENKNHQHNQASSDHALTNNNNDNNTFEFETRRITKQIFKKQQQSNANILNENSINEDMLFHGYSNNEDSIVGTRPMHWGGGGVTTRRIHSLSDRSKSNVSSSLSKATMTRITIPSSIKHNKNSIMKSTLSSATLPSKSLIVTTNNGSNTMTDNVTPKRLFNPTSNNMAPTDQETNNDNDNFELNQEGHSNNGRVDFLPSFLSQTNNIDDSYDKNTRSPSFLDIVDKEDTNMNDRIDIQQNNNYNTPKSKKRKQQKQKPTTTEGFLLSELFSLRNQIEQDINKIQKSNISLHYNYIDVDIVSTTNNIITTTNNSNNNILGYIHQMKTYAWLLHCNTMYNVGDKIRIYNSIVMPTKNDDDNGGNNDDNNNNVCCYYPMILCTQIWKYRSSSDSTSNNNTTENILPTCSFLSEEL